MLPSSISRGRRAGLIFRHAAERRPGRYCPPAWLVAGEDPNTSRADKATLIKTNGRAQDVYSARCG
jgi:hypothetical protein